MLVKPEVMKGWKKWGEHSQNNVQNMLDMTWDCSFAFFKNVALMLLNPRDQHLHLKRIRFRAREFKYQDQEIF